MENFVSGGIELLEPGLHIIVRRITSMCLRPWPKEYIKLSRCRLQKSLVRDCYYQRHVLPFEKDVS